MCTVVLSFRPDHAWPVCLVANRDERIDRPWDLPAAWWPDLPDVVAGRDRTAGDAIQALGTAEWRGFNMVIADRTRALYLRGAGDDHPSVHSLAPGVTMITSLEPNDLASPRVTRHLPRFQNAAAPMPDNWEDWRAILADQSGPAGAQINVAPRAG